MQGKVAPSDTTLSDPPLVWTNEERNRSPRAVIPILDQIAEHGQLASLCGLLPAVEPAGVRWLQQRVVNQAFQGRLVLAVWPACPTGAPELGALWELQAQTLYRVEFRLLLCSGFPSTPGHSLCCVTFPSGDPLLFLGSDSLWQAAPVLSKAPNVAFKSEPLLLGRWSDWFNKTWECAIPLRQQSARIPALAPAKGTQEAAELWRTYERGCLQATVQPELSAVNAVADVQTEDEGKGPRKTATEQLGLKPLDPLQERLARLYNLGKLVQIDESTRRAPLHVPVTAELFGIPGIKTVGSVSREVRYQIKAFDENTYRTLDNIRKSTAELLPRFSFSLGRGVHWMPNAAWPLFATELEASEGEGKELLTRLVGEDATGYVQQRLPQIRAEANELYQEFKPGQKLPEPELLKIVSALTERIERALRGGLVPRVTPSLVGFAPASGSTWISQWGQAYSLLLGIATHARKALTQHFYYFRGLSVDRDELLTAMDVCADHLLQADVRWNSRAEALKELDELKDIQRMEPRSDETDDELLKRKCAAILNLMAGAPTSLFEISEQRSAR